MKVIITKETVVIAEYSCINEGEVCVNTCYFDLPECFEGLCVTAAFNNIPVPVTDNKCNIPSLKKGTVTLGVYAYREDEDGVTLMYSPKPTVFYVNQGSYSEEIGVEEMPSVTEFEQYCRNFSDEMQKTLIDTEQISNKVTSIDETSTDEQYPSAKAVYDLFGNIEVSGGAVSGVGLNSTAISLLIQILKECIYSSNVSGKIDALETALAQGGSGGSGSGGSDDIGDSSTSDDITVTDGIMTIISVGSEISVTDGVMTIL